MSLPYFYLAHLDPLASNQLLDEDNSRHVVQVLRMKEGEQLHLTDGKGNFVLATIKEADKKKCKVNVLETRYIHPPQKRISIAISLLKNTSRFEWFLEKATEIGINEIIPLHCERTEKEKFRQDRLQGILISAMLQSQQSWLPVLHDPIAYPLLFRQEEIADTPVKLIAHCTPDADKQLLKTFDKDVILLIGPEGDFTRKEIELARENHFMPVTLGATRLRTETAGIVAATLLKNLA
jgi:16S rRNA (uracil1498-N3)-methyltransferase